MLLNSQFLVLANESSTYFDESTSSSLAIENLQESLISVSEEMTISSLENPIEYGIENVPLVHCFLPLSAKKCTSKCDAVTISNNKSDNNDHKVN